MEKLKRCTITMVVAIAVLIACAAASTEVFADDGDNTITITLHANHDNAFFEEWNSSLEEYERLDQIEYPVVEGEEFSPYGGYNLDIVEGAKIQFAGWSLQENGDIIDWEYLPQDGDHLYAQWDNVITITLHANNENAYLEGEWNDDLEDYEHVDQVPYTLTEGSTFGPYDGYGVYVEDGAAIQFAGWSLQENGDIIDEDYVPQDGDDLYAQWEDTITITLHANHENAYFEKWIDGQDDPERVDQIEYPVVEGEEFGPYGGYNPDIVEGAKIEFAGWSLQENGDIIDDDYIPQSGDHLYAQWDNVITITLHANHENAYFEEWDEDTGEYKQFKQMECPLAEGETFGPYDGITPDVEDGAAIQFAGWSLQENGPIIGKDYVPRDGDNLYAQWDETITIILHANHEKAYYEEWDDALDEYVHVPQVEYPVVKNEEFGPFDGYTPEVEDGAEIQFAGWSLQENGQLIDEDYVPQAGANLYAQWKKEDQHDHVIVRVEAHPATCTENGNTEHWTCNICHKLFSDEEGTEEIEESDTVISKKDHAYGAWTRLNDSQHQRICSHDATHVETANHAWDAGKVTKEPTVDANGTKTFTCTVCNAVRTESISNADIKKKAEDNKVAPDGTAVGKGAGAAAAEKAITTAKNDKDPAGSLYGILQLRSSSQTKSAITLKWVKAKGATKYVVYGNVCGKNKTMKKLTSTTKNSFKVKKISNKLQKGKYHKFIVVAIDKNNKVVSTSKIVHVATTGGKVTNPKSVTVKKDKKTVSKVSVGAGKTITLKNTVVTKNKKLKLQKHRAVSYESSNTGVATVTSKGKIKGIKKGTAYVYAYSQSGIAKKIKVTVK